MTELYACLASGNCMKPWLAMTQLGRDFELKLVDVLSGENRAPAYLEINPRGVVPYLVDDDSSAQGTEGRIGIGESNAILWYLAEGTSLMPETPADRARALQWMFFEQSKLEPYLSPARFFLHILPDQAEARAQDIIAWQDQARSGLETLENHLKDRAFILESGYCVADIALFGYVHLLDEAGLDPGDYPYVMRWVDRVTATPGFMPLRMLGTMTRRAA